MSESTPGPWRVVVDDTGGPFTGWPSVVASEERDCGVVHRAGFRQEHWGELNQDECLANARLIAAAPEMLEVVELATRIVAHDAQDGALREKAQQLLQRVQGATVETVQAVTVRTEQELEVRATLVSCGDMRCGKCRVCEAAKTFAPKPKWKFW